MAIVISDKALIKKVDHLKKSRGYSSLLETVTKLIEDEYDDEVPSDCPNCIHFDNKYCKLFNCELEDERWCTGFKRKEASK